MEIRQFKYFIQIADLGSFSKASKVLHIAQPALSQQMAQLEDELGQALLSRHATGVRLTDQGKIFYLHAQRLVKQLADTRTAVSRSADNPVGRVCVGLPQSTASRYAMPLLHALRERYPGIEVEFFDELSGNLFQGLHGGRLDIGVLVNDEPANMLQSVALMDEALFLISHPTMAPKGKALSLKQLARLPLTIPGKGQGIRPILDSALAASCLQLDHPPLVANSISIMKRAVHDGLAHCIMPWAAVEDELAAGLFASTQAPAILHRRVYVCTARDADLSVAGQVVLGTLIDSVRRQARSGEWKGVTPL